MQKKQSERICDIAYGIFITAGILVPLLRSEKQAKGGIFYSLGIFGLSYLTSQSLKRVVAARRPDSLETNSFPSGHTMNAMAVATTTAALQRQHAPFWYLIPPLIGVWRVRLGRHRPHEVFAGGILGFLLARLTLSRRSV